MNSSANQKPSNFSLSRYILGESSDEEKAIIEQWIEHSDESRQQFEIYKQSIIREEQAAPTLFKNSFSSRKTSLKVKFSEFRLKLAIPTIAFSIVLCLLFFSLHFFRNTSNKMATTNSDSNHEYSQGFRDSLAFLRKITNQNIYSTSSPGSDLSGQSVTLYYDSQSATDYNRADRTGIFKE